MPPDPPPHAPRPSQSRCALRYYNISPPWEILYKTLNRHISFLVTRVECVSCGVGLKLSAGSESSNVCVGLAHLGLRL